MNYYPDRVYPETPQFPIGHDDVPWGPDMYTAVAAYIAALTTDMVNFETEGGDLEIGSSKGIAWDSSVRISLSGGEIKFSALQVNTELVVATATLEDVTCSGNVEVGNDVIDLIAIVSIGGTVTMDYFDRVQHMLNQSAEPGDPADNTAVIWVSNGTGYGDAGDVVCKITEGGGTTDFTIADYSAL